MNKKEYSIVILIITYNPDQRFLFSLETAKKVGNHVVIVDNNSNDKSFIKNIRENLDAKNITILELQSNRGIAGALNCGVKYIKDNFNIEYILTLDQDTIIVSNNIGTIITEANKRFDRVGIIALGTNDTKKLIDYKEVKKVITSGNLVKLEVFNSLRFREEFFMDQVDFDFDFDVRNLGYKIIIANGDLIDHRLGNKIGNLFYEPLDRVYYIVRNSTILLFERKISYSEYIYQILFWSRSSIINDGFIRYIKTFIKGINDAFSRRLGKM